jgi:hypothetical protein
VKVLFFTVLVVLRSFQFFAGWGVASTKKSVARAKKNALHLKRTARTTTTHMQKVGNMIGIAMMTYV